METTKEIREKMKKELGYNANQVSVKARSCSIIFTVRDVNVNIEKLTSFSNQFEHIDRDEYSGEILSGGNTFVHVEISDQVRSVLLARELPTVKEAVDKLGEQTSYGEHIGDRFVVFRDNWSFKVWDNDKNTWMPMHYSSAEHIALDLAILKQAVRP